VNPGGAHEGLLRLDSKSARRSTGWLSFADAGAIVFYAPGVKKREDIAAMVKAVAPKPVKLC